MAIIRMSSGADLKIELSVKEALEVFSTISHTPGFVEVEGEDGLVYLRQNEVIAIFPEPKKHGAGFQFDGEGSAKKSKK